MSFTLVVDLSELDGSVWDAEYLWLKPIDSTGKGVTVTTAQTTYKNTETRYEIAELPVDGQNKPTLVLATEADASQPPHFGYKIDLGKDRKLTVIVPAGQEQASTHRIREFVTNTAGSIPLNPSDQARLSELEAEITGFDGRIGTVETSVDDLSTTVGGFTGAIDSLDSRVDAVEAALPNKVPAARTLAGLDLSVDRLASDLRTALSVYSKAEGDTLYKPASTYGPTLFYNQCPYCNLRTDTTGWGTSGYGNGTGNSARVAAAGINGEAAYVVTWTGAASSGGGAFGPYAAAARAACAPGQKVAASVFAKSTVDAAVYVRIQFYTAGGAANGTQTGGIGGTLRAGDGFTRVSASSAFGPIEAPANTAFVSFDLRLDVASSMGAGGVLTLSGAQLNVGATSVRPYVNGDQLGGLWQGAVGASASAKVLGGVQTQQIAMFGNSHTGSAQDGGYTAPEHLQSMLGGPECLNLGRGGETATGIAIRQGGVVPTVSNVAGAPGGSIPASGSVALTITPNTTFNSTGSWNFYGSIAGVYGTLNRTTGSSWTFTRTNAGSATPVPDGTPFLVAPAAQFANLVIIEAGANNAEIVDTRIAIAGMVTLARSRNQRVLLLSIYNSGYGTGNPTYDAMMANNAWMAATYPNEYFDINGWLKTNGLAMLGITPTANDIADAALDKIPRSLMQGDGVHLTNAARKAAMSAVQSMIAKRGLLVS